MATLTIYDSFLNDVFTGAVSVPTDTFYMMLAANAYTPNKGTHARRSSVSNEISGSGYVSGGQVVTLGVTLDTGAHTLTVSIGASTWTTATLTARHAIIYKRRGGLASADELVGCITSDTDIISTNGSWTQPSVSYAIQN